VPIARFLRVVVFQPSGDAAPVDAVLRAAVVPRLLDRDDVVDAWIGRQSAPDDRGRVLVSTWTADPGADPADLTALRDAAPTGEPPAIAGVDQLELMVHARFERSEPARILRVFRGVVRPGELEAYTADARAGMTADAAVNDGLIAFALGVEPPVGFVTASAWTGWSAIEAATGGNTRQPFATQHSARLASFAIVHFEVLPETPTRGRTTGSD